MPGWAYQERAIFAPFASRSKKPLQRVLSEEAICTLIFQIPLGDSADFERVDPGAAGLGTCP
jgi:hypothetical protein